MRVFEVVLCEFSRFLTRPDKVCRAPWLPIRTNKTNCALAGDCSRAGREAILGGKYLKKFQSCTFLKNSLPAKGELC